MVSTNISQQSSDFSNCAFVGEVGFTVTTHVDGGDPDPGDFECDVSGTANTCSFDAALDEIHGLVGYGPFRISFDVDDFDDIGLPFQMDGAALEIISKQVIIDGRTQAGTQCQGLSGTSNTMLKLPTPMRLASGSDGSIVRGLYINAGQGDGIQVFSDDNQLDCLSIFGPTGSDDGIDSVGDGNTIGGPEDWQRNFIRNLDDDGIVLSAAATSNLIYNTELHSNGTGISVVGGAYNNQIGGRMELVGGELVEIGRNQILFSDGDGIVLDGGGDNNIGGNDIGVQDGSTNGGNDTVGIRVLSDDNTIGRTRGYLGTFYDVPNVIGNNAVTGIHVDANDTFIFGNLIGFASDGVTDRGNTLNGIFVAAGSTGTIIENNTIGHNGAHGISLRAGSTDIYANRIGVAANGSTAAGNGFNGILVDGTSVDIGRVGDPTKGNNILYNGQRGVYLDTNADAVDVAGNTIAGNSQSGIGVHRSASRGFFVQNSFIDNGGLAIDLNDDGEPAPNDPGDEDTGGNGLVNSVTLHEALTDGTILFEFSGAPDMVHLVEFYKNGQCDDDDFGEGETALEERITFTTDGDGYFANQASGYKLDEGDILTALISDVNLNTSEFSQCLEVEAIVGTTPTAVQLAHQQSAGSHHYSVLLVALWLSAVATGLWWHRSRR